jgi:hypothetical protein
VADLITLAELQSALPNLTADQIAAAPARITAVSAAIERYCRRRFTAVDRLVAYGETDNAGGLRLPGPIRRSRSLFVGPPETAITATLASGDFATIDFTFSTTSEGYWDCTTAPATILVVVTTNGAATESTITLNATTTVDDVATALTAAGFSATTWASYSAWNARLLLPDSQVIRNGESGALRLLPNPGEIVERGVSWQRTSARMSRYRYEFDGGYSSIPADVKEAAIQSASMQLMLPNAMNAMVGGIVSEEYQDVKLQYGVTQTEPSRMLQESVKAMLAPYRRRDF